MTITITPILYEYVYIVTVYIKLLQASTMAHYFYEREPKTVIPKV